MTGLRIIEGDARDVAAIMPVMDAAFDPAFGEAWTAGQCLSLLTVPGSTLVLAEVGHQVVGFAMTRWILDEEELLMIGVHPEHQRQRIAHNLLSFILRRAREHNRTRIFLEVRSNNPASLFYKSFGFEYSGTRKGYYRGDNGVRYDATTMTLNL
ncbi:ribosomal protein S18-alanine N-acetyltransferase [Sphingorhabdus sp.]|uniref:ribosomal protein S18-alanine N-acetyltransferase n=1 Tax=Sphingorhabdus sp. TaxID=1902408 RepID=UPI0035B469FC